MNAITHFFQCIFLMKLFVIEMNENFLLTLISMIHSRSLDVMLFTDFFDQVPLLMELSHFLHLFMERLFYFPMMVYGCFASKPYW